MLSVILPAYNEEKMISTAVAELNQALGETIPHELVFVDDGSTDGTWQAICRQAETDTHVVGIHFSRNFGKEAAMFAGLEKAAGDCCLIMDCDLQHPPEKIPEMVELWRQGYEVVEGIKENRGEETAAHRMAAGTFYRLMSRATGMDMSSSSDFKLLDRKVVDALNAMPERGVFFRALSHWVGYRRAEVRYDVRERTVGSSKWSTRKLIGYALESIASFSAAPMQIVTGLGVLSLIAGVVYGIVSLFLRDGLGLLRLPVFLLLLLGGIIMLALGVIGFYLERIYRECQRRPRYLIAETCGRASSSQKA